MAKIIFRWDLDKTYLKTDFDKVSSLFKTFFQAPEKKETFAGARALLLALMSVHESKVTFVSGSPKQMRKKLLEKLSLDGIQVDELVLKPNFSNAVRGRFRALREQVGYKLPALLRMRFNTTEGSQEICFGDDAEADAFVYCLYDAVVRGEVTEDETALLMKQAGAYKDQIKDARKWIRRNQEKQIPDPLVRRIFIHLERKSRPSRFKDFGQRVVAIFNYFQAGLVLYSDDLLTQAQVNELALNMIQEGEYDALRLANSFQDIIRRLRLPLDKMTALCHSSTVESQSLLHQFWALCAQRLNQLDKNIFETPLPPDTTLNFQQLIKSGALDRKKNIFSPPDPALALSWLDPLLEDDSTQKDL